MLQRRRAVELEFDRVEASGLVKLYGSTRALGGVTATFEAGKCTVVEGPNGSGKSTLLAILAQLARPTRGTVRYGAHDGRSGGAALRGRIGVLAHGAMIYPDLTARENLRLFATLYGLASPSDVVSRLAERFEIGSWIDRPARTYSRGQLQRVSVARAVMHAPRLLLLDEPSTGLDARALDRLADVVGEERDRGAIVVLVTHDAPFAERVAERRVRLERGRVVTPEAEPAEVA